MLLMDKKSVENMLSRIDDKVDRIQDPIEQVVDTINSLISYKEQTESEDLIVFKIQLSKILDNFSKEMVNVNDEIIEEFKSIEKIINHW